MPAASADAARPSISHRPRQANILFGLDEDGKRLRAAVHAAGFSEDVGRFEHGLATAVAEKGSSLSGGCSAAGAAIESSGLC